MIDGRFLKAFTDPACVKIAGRVVYPFCLKYRVRLLAIESTLITGDRLPAPLDLVIAAKVCAEEPLGDLTKDELRLVEWYRTHPGKFLDECERFTQYALTSSWPRFWETPEATKGSAEDAGIPWILGIVANLIKNGIEEKRAWEMPECQAIWLNAAWAAASGSESKILTTEEEAFMDEQERLEKVAPPADVKTPEPNGTET